MHKSHAGYTKILIFIPKNLLDFADLATPLLRSIPVPAPPPKRIPSRDNTLVSPPLRSFFACSISLQKLDGRKKFFRCACVYFLVASLYRCHKSFWRSHEVGA